VAGRRSFVSVCPIISRADGLAPSAALVSDAICRTAGQYEALRFVVRRADGDRIPSGSKTLNRILTAGECRTTDDEIECGRNQGSTGIVLLAETCRLRLIAL